MMRYARYILVFLIFATPAVIGLNASDSETTYESNKAHWAEMSEDEKSSVVRTYRRWKGLPEDDRDALLDKYDKFKGLSRDQKLAVAVNAKRWLRLKPAKRDRIRGYKKFRGHPPVHVLFRIVGLLMEDGKTVTKQSVARRFKLAFGSATSRLLNAEQKKAYQALTGEQAKRKFVFGVLSEKVKKENPKRLRDLIPGSKAYRQEIMHLVMEMFRKEVEESLPTSQMEMAHYFRRKIPRELLKKLASVSDDDLDKVVAKIAKLTAVKNLVQKMPEKMRKRFMTFSAEKKLATLKMALKPFGELGRMRLRMFSNGHRHPPCPEHGPGFEHGPRPGCGSDSRRGGRSPRGVSPTPGPE